MRLAVNLCIQLFYKCINFKLCLLELCIFTDDRWLKLLFYTIYKENSIEYKKTITKQKIHDSHCISNCNNKLLNYALLRRVDPGKILINSLPLIMIHPNIHKQIHSK